MKGKSRNEGRVLLLGEGGRQRFMKILKRMKEETELLERIMKKNNKEETK